jgi:lysophospholipase L1-like esterase
MLLPLTLVLLAAAPPAPRLEVAGDWSVRVTRGTVLVDGREVRIGSPVTLAVAPPVRVRVRDEKHDPLPPYDEKAAPFWRGARLGQLVTVETTAPDLLLPETVVVKRGPGDGERLQQGKDYGLEPRWATFGRLAAGPSAVWVDYDCEWSRLDAIMVSREGKVQVVQGKAHPAVPVAPEGGRRQTVIGHVWVPGRLARLTPDNLYPILATEYPEPKAAAPPAATLLPRAWGKLTRGEPLHILAWGDSVTAGGDASSEATRYQSRFLALLRERFPAAQLKLTTAAWGGRTSDHFLREPPDSQYNFERAVLAPRPDLIVMEFVNDAWMSPEVVEQKYSHLLARFREVGAEWVILTPHFVRPDWMNAPSVRVEQDPRPYVAGLRAFASKHRVALADASLRWGHLLRQGIPYTTLLSNSINHPDDRGHELFARSLMELFGGVARAPASAPRD